MSVLLGPAKSPRKPVIVVVDAAPVPAPKAVHPTIQAARVEARHIIVHTIVVATGVLAVSLFVFAVIAHARGWI